MLLTNQTSSYKTDQVYSKKKPQLPEPAVSQKSNFQDCRIRIVYRLNVHLGVQLAASKHNVLHNVLYFTLQLHNLEVTYSPKNQQQQLKNI